MCQKVALGVRLIADLALLVTGCVGAAGLLPSSTLAGATAGLAGGILAISVAAALATSNLKKHKFTLIANVLSTAIFVTLAALGATGILSTTQLGWGVIGTWLPNMLMACGSSCLSKLCAPNNSSDTSM